MLCAEKFFIQDHKNQEIKAHQNHFEKKPQNPIIDTQTSKVGTGLSTNIASLKELASGQKGNLSEQQSHQAQVHGMEIHGHPKNLTKETSEKYQGAGVHAVSTHHQSKHEDHEEVFDDELLKELEKDVNNSRRLKNFAPDQDAATCRNCRRSRALDSEYFQDHSPIFGQNGNFDPHKENLFEGEQSLALNLTDLKIEHHS